MDTTSTERTREALSKHRALPLRRRVAQRLLGHYPSLKDRREVKDEDRQRAWEALGVVGRTKKRIESAVEYTNLYSSKRVPLMEGKVRVKGGAIESDKTIAASLRFYTAKVEGAQELIHNLGFLRDSTRSIPERVGVYTVRPSGDDTSGDSTEVGLFLTDGEESILEKIPLTDDTINGLDSAAQERLEQVTGHIYNEAYKRYIYSDGHMF